MEKFLSIMLLFLLAASAWGESDTVSEQLEEELVSEHGAAPQVEGEDEDEASWIEAGHTYATDQVQALTVWMDNFFGDPNYDLEKATSLVRIIWNHEFDDEDDYNGKVKIRGKLQMPRISKRMNLVFSGEDGDALSADERKDADDTVGLQYILRELDRTRLDTTIAWAGGDLRPGLRYRNQGPIGERSGYRYTQRFEYESDEGFFTTGELNLDRVVTDHTLARWNNRVRYGEETDGAEWRSLLALGDRRRPERVKQGQTVVGYFAGVNGVTDPSYIRNYRLGMVFRRQVYNRFLFAELEPSYNWRQDDAGQDRYGAWNVIFRLELLLEEDRRRKSGRAQRQPTGGENAPGSTVAAAAPGSRPATDSPPQTPPGVNEQSR